MASGRLPGNVGAKGLFEQLCVRGREPAISGKHCDCGPKGFLGARGRLLLQHSGKRLWQAQLCKQELAPKCPVHLNEVSSGNALRAQGAGDVRLGTHGAPLPRDAPAQKCSLFSSPPSSVCAAGESQHVLHCQLLSNTLFLRVPFLPQARQGAQVWVIFLTAWSGMRLCLFSGKGPFLPLGASACHRIWLRPPSTGSFHPTARKGCRGPLRGHS